MILSVIGQPVLLEEAQELMVAAKTTSTIAVKKIFFIAEYLLLDYFASDLQR